MSVTVDINIPLWDGNDTPTIEGQRIFEGVAEEIALKLLDPGFTWEEAGVAENFGNTTGTLRTNAGRVDFVNVETDIKTYGRKDMGAGAIAGAFTIDFHFQYGAEVSGPLIFCAGATDADASAGADLATSGNGILVRYAGDAMRIVSVTAGTPSYGTSLAVAPNTDFYCRLRRNADNTIDFLIYLTSGMVNPPFASQIGFPGDSNAYRYRHTMTIKPNLAGRTITCWQNYLDFNGTLYDWFLYSTTSPSPVVPWATLLIQSVIDMSSFHIPENMNSGDAGSLKYKYAANGDALSASLTQAQLRAVGDITITDEVESFKLVVQFISDGIQKTTVVVFARVNVLLPAAADVPAEGNVRLGIVYDNGNLTGTAAIPGASDVRSGVAVDDTTGTAAIPGANDVRLDVPVDDTIGNYVPADPEKHALGDQYGSLGTEFTGTAVFTSFQLPEEIVVEDSEIIIYEGAS